MLYPFVVFWQPGDGCENPVKYCFLDNIRPIGSIRILDQGPSFGLSNNQIGATVPETQKIGDPNALFSNFVLNFTNNTLEMFD